MDTATIIAELNDLNPDACLFDNMETALIGIGRIAHKDPVAVYSKAQIYSKLLADGFSQEDADEYFLGRFMSVWAGDNTPVIVNYIME